MRNHDGRAIAENLRASLWFWPVISAAVAIVLAVGLSQVRPDPGTAWAPWFWSSDTQSASTLLQVVATSIMTATTMTFSLTVVALQLASQQFSPRLLREFARDRLTQSVLALLVSTFVLCLMGLRAMQPDRPVPVLLVALALVLGIACAGALLGFVGHIVRALRVDTMMVSVRNETVSALHEAYPDYDDLSKVPQLDLPGPEDGTLIPTRRSGFVRDILPERLVAGAQEHGMFVRLDVRPGDHLVAGAPVGRAWRSNAIGTPSVDVLEDALRHSIAMGFERTIEQDAALGLRQLTDIAVKAISPGINDPITAGHAVGYCGELICQLQGKHLGPQQHNDDAGVPRVITADRDHRYYLDLVCAPIRRFGRKEPIVLTALLRMLRDCAVASRDAEQRNEISRQAELILTDMDATLLDDDADAVRDLARRVKLALHGDIDGAFRDRAGETRSL